MSEMLPFDPFVTDDTKLATPGLREAYEYARYAVEAGFDLVMWKVLLLSSEDQGIITIDDDENDDHVIDDGDDLLFDDPELHEAIKRGLLPGSSQKAGRAYKCSAIRSRPFSACSKLQRSQCEDTIPYETMDELDFRTHRRLQPYSNLLTPVPSPPREANSIDYLTSGLKRPSLHSLSGSDNDTSSSVQRIKRRRDSITPSQDIPLINDPSTDEDFKIPKRVLQQSSLRSVDLAGSVLSAQETFVRKCPKAPAATAPVGDVIEEDL